MITRDEKIMLERFEINAVNKELKNFKEDFPKAQIGRWINSGGQATVYFLKTKAGGNKYVIKISKDGFEKTINFSNNFSGNKEIDGLFLKVESCFDVIIRKGRNIYTLHCIIEKYHPCLDDYIASGLNPKRDDREIAIRLGADLLPLLIAMEGKYVHRDIKPGNIFLKTTRLSDGFCLGDFGIVTSFSDGTLKTQILRLGTAETASPDIILRDRPYEVAVEGRDVFKYIFRGSTKGDMYSLAATMYYYLNDRTFPFIDRYDGKALDENYWEKIRKTDCEAPEYGSQKLKDIVCKALKFDPEERFASCAEMLNALKETDEYKEFAMNHTGNHDTITHDKTHVPVNIKSEDDEMNFDFVVPFGSSGEYTGKRLDDRYEIKEVISTSNIAVVYKAYDLIDDRIVAVKILKEEHLANEELCRRFKNDSKAAAVLFHQNIVRIYNVAYGDKLQYMVTEYVEGIDLKEFIKQNGKLGLKPSLYIAEQVLRAFQHAHNKGVVHGNSNSHNIKILSNGRVLVDDFGIPHSGHSGAVSFRDDICSVGEILYEMLTGQNFYVNNMKSPREVNNAVPIGLEQIIMYAISKGYRSAADMLAEIETYRRNPAVRFTRQVTPLNPLEEELKKWDNNPVKIVTGTGGGKKGKSKLKYVAAAALILVFGLGCIAFGSYHSDLSDAMDDIRNYRKAVSFVKDGDKVNAALHFEKADDYKDAEEQCFALWDEIAFRETVSAGYDHTVGVKADGTVVAVGDNDHNQCDTEKWADIVAVSAGAIHTVGLKSDGTVIAVGDNEHNQCDTEKWTDIVAVSAGYYHTAGLKFDGTVVTTGYNDNGRCDTDEWTDIVAVYAGGYHTVGLKSDGTVVAVGSNSDGQCDTEKWADIVAVSAGTVHTVGLKSDGTVVAVGGNEKGKAKGQCNVDDWTDIVAVSAGDYHTLGIRSDGTVVATGCNEYIQCDVYNWKNIIAVSAGGYYTVGLKSDASVVAVGNNSKGQCNVSGWENMMIPERIPTTDRNDTENEFSLNNFSVKKNVSAGNYHTAGIKSDGTVVAVGSNSDGQCNVNDWTGITAVSAGGQHTAGLKFDGTVIAVGKNDDGQCNVSEWTDIVSVSAGDDHTAGLKSDGTVAAVGNNDYGQCNVTGWTDVVSVSAGRHHTVGLKPDGTVVAVGSNSDGQCNVSNWTDIIAVSAGDYHTVALKSDGTVVAVGKNDRGQCDVSEWTDITEIFAGYYHTTALKSDGTVVAVGLNDQGQCDVSDWTDIVEISANSYHTVGIKSNGKVVAVGYHDDRCNVSAWENIKHF